MTDLRRSAENLLNDSGRLFQLKDDLDAVSGSGAVDRPRI